MKVWTFDIIEKYRTAMVINTNGEGDHPYADKDNLEFFDKKYILECFERYEAKIKKG